MHELAQLPLRPIQKNTPGLSRHEARQIITKLPGWDIDEKEDGLRLVKVYDFEDYLQGITFVNRVAQTAQAENHHPAILIEWRKVTITWWTHAIQGLHQNDFIMAAKTGQLYNSQSAAHL